MLQKSSFVKKKDEQGEVLQNDEHDTIPNEKPDTKMRDDTVHNSNTATATEVPSDVNKDDLNTGTGKRKHPEIIDELGNNLHTILENAGECESDDKGSQDEVINTSSKPQKTPVTKQRRNENIIKHISFNSNTSPPNQNSPANILPLQNSDAASHQTQSKKRVAKIAHKELASRGRKYNQGKASLEEENDDQEISLSISQEHDNLIKLRHGEECKYLIDCQSINLICQLEPQDCSYKEVFPYHLEIQQEYLKEHKQYLYHQIFDTPKHRTRVNYPVYDFMCNKLNKKYANISEIAKTIVVDYCCEEKVLLNEVINDDAESDFRYYCALKKPDCIEEIYGNFCFSHHFLLKRLSALGIKNILSLVEYWNYKWPDEINEVKNTLSLLQQQRQKQEDLHTCPKILSAQFCFNHIRSVQKDLEKLYLYPEWLQSEKQALLSQMKKTLKKETECFLPLRYDNNVARMSHELENSSTSKLLDPYFVTKQNLVNVHSILPHNVIFEAGNKKQDFELYSLWNVPEKFLIKDGSTKHTNKLLQFVNLFKQLFQMEMKDQSMALVLFSIAYKKSFTEVRKQYEKKEAWPHGLDLVMLNDIFFIRNFEFIRFVEIGKVSKKNDGEICSENSFKDLMLAFAAHNNMNLCPKSEEQLKENPIVKEFSTSIQQVLDKQNKFSEMTNVYVFEVKHKLDNPKGRKSTLDHGFFEYFVVRVFRQVETYKHNWLLVTSRGSSVKHQSYNYQISPSQIIKEGIGNYIPLKEIRTITIWNVIPDYKEINSMPEKERIQRHIKRSLVKLVYHGFDFDVTLKNFRPSFSAMHHIEEAISNPDETIKKLQLSNGKFIPPQITNACYNISKIDFETEEVKFIQVRIKFKFDRFQGDILFYDDNHICSQYKKQLDVLCNQCFIQLEEDFESYDRCNIDLSNNNTAISYDNEVIQALEIWMKVSQEKEKKLREQQIINACQSKRIVTKFFAPVINEENVISRMIHKKLKDIRRLREQKKQTLDKLKARMIGDGQITQEQFEKKQKEIFDQKKVNENEQAMALYQKMISDAENKELLQIIKTEGITNDNPHMIIDSQEKMPTYMQIDDKSPHQERHLAPLSQENLRMLDQFQSQQQQVQENLIKQKELFDATNSRGYGCPVNHKLRPPFDKENEKLEDPSLQLLNEKYPDDQLVPAIEEFSNSSFKKHFDAKMIYNYLSDVYKKPMAWNITKQRDQVFRILRSSHIDSRSIAGKKVRYRNLGGSFIILYIHIRLRQVGVVIWGKDDLYFIPIDANLPKPGQDPYEKGEIEVKNPKTGEIKSFINIKNFKTSLQIYQARRIQQVMASSKDYSAFLDDFLKHVQEVKENKKDYPFPYSTYIDEPDYTERMDGAGYFELEVLSTLDSKEMSVASSIANYRMNPGPYDDYEEKEQDEEEHNENEDENDDKEHASE